MPSSTENGSKARSSRTQDMKPQLQVPQQVIDSDVERALSEDIGSGDINAGLIAQDSTAAARVITREAGVLCGQRWATAVFAAVDARCRLDWLAQDGDTLAPGQTLFTVTGPSRALLTAERTALNFLQTLSGTATRCDHYRQRIAGQHTRILDTRKTLPGLRMAQKYAVSCGGCHNHRLGLFDAFLIKENHIAASGGIAAAVAAARQLAPDKPVEVEVESPEELREAIAAGAERIMLDNFDLDAMRDAVALAAGCCELEASGNVTLDTLAAIAATGVDFVSIGALTKDVQSLDLSMRFS